MGGRSKRPWSSWLRGRGCKGGVDAVHFQYAAEAVGPDRCDEIVGLVWVVEGVSVWLPSIQSRAG